MVWVVKSREERKEYLRSKRYKPESFGTFVLIFLASQFLVLIGYFSAENQDSFRSHFIAGFAMTFVGYGIFLVFTGLGSKKTMQVPAVYTTGNPVLRGMYHQSPESFPKPVYGYMVCVHCQEFQERFSKFKCSTCGSVTLAPESVKWVEPEPVKFEPEPALDKRKKATVRQEPVFTFKEEPAVSPKQPERGKTRYRTSLVRRLRR